MPKFKSREVVVEGVRYTGENRAEIAEFAGPHARWAPTGAAPEDQALLVENPSGWSAVDRGAWVLTAGPGDFYPCPDEVFQKKYDPTPVE